MHFINGIINIFYPKACGICGSINKYDICPKCMRKLNEIKQCKKHIYLKRSFTDEMYIFKYEDIVRSCFIKYKFGEQNYRYKAFANFMIKDKKICGFLKKYDIIIPVPISKTRKRQRGYNQSELIIKECTKLDKDIKVCTNILYKIKNTKPQSSLNKEQRKINIQGAYIIKNNEIINNKKILLFDDIYTTGSTLEECAKVLRQAGAYEVSVLTFAKD
ncbi:MAG: ComF family protein [Clostridia bacterium]|nr:ComF family protein [Clostridia bacterium]